jgi:hypothetical protein
MNKKGETISERNDLLQDNMIYLILGLLFFVVMLGFISNQMNGASKFEDSYAKEIAKVINLAQPGDEITLDVQKATEIAGKNNMEISKKIFTFDNANNRICVKLSASRRKCYSYFNNVDILDYDLKLGAPINLLTLKVSKKIKSD